MRCHDARVSGRWGRNSEIQQQLETPPESRNLALKSWDEVAAASPVDSQKKKMMMMMMKKMKMMMMMMKKKKKIKKKWWW